MSPTEYRIQLLGPHSDIYASDYGADILANNVAIAAANKNEVVLKFGDEISMMVLLLKGKFSVYMKWAEQGLVKVYEVLPGDFCSVNYINGLHKTPSDFQIVADDDVSFALVPIEYMENKVNQYPELRSHFFNDIQAKQRAIMSSINAYTKDLLAIKNRKTSVNALHL